MKPLTEARKGSGIWIWNVYFYINFARSGLWAKDRGDREERRTSLFELSYLETPDTRAINIHLLPIKIMIGWPKK